MPRIFLKQALVWNNISKEVEKVACSLWASLLQGPLLLGGGASVLMGEGEPAFSSSLSFPTSPRGSPPFTKAGLPRCLLRGPLTTASSMTDTLEGCSCSPVPPIQWKLLTQVLLEDTAYDSVYFAICGISLSLISLKCSLWHFFCCPLGSAWFQQDGGQGSYLNGLYLPIRTSSSFSLCPLPFKYTREPNPGFKKSLCKAAAGDQIKTCTF